MCVEISFPCLSLFHPGSLGLLYADPGSGALAWQLLVSLLFGAMFYLRTVTRKLRSFITARQNRQLVAKVAAPRLENSSAALSKAVLTKAEDY